MRQAIFTFLAGLAVAAPALAQMGCPGCLIQLPNALSPDTIYIEKIPDGEKDKSYNADVSFRLPKTTTPVAAIDPSVPAGLPISKFEISEVKNLPPGLSWEANKYVFEPALQTDGCIKICGVPTVTDTFIIVVKLKVAVLFFYQDHIIPLRMVVHPKSSSTPGFHISAVEGCPPLTVHLTNNLPSNGKAGFEYSWQWGDSTQFKGENPPPVTFHHAGTYPIRYHAKIDTAPYQLKAITILKVECVDQLGTGLPDLYFFVKDKSGKLVVPPEADVKNVTLPHTFKTNLPLSADNYTLELWDEDAGLKGGDDLCGRITFNYLMGGDTLVSGNFTVILTIEKPIVELVYRDTVRVFPSPPTPMVQFPSGLTQCEGETKVVLISSIPNNNVWLKNGVIIPNSHDFLYLPTLSGKYAVQVKNSFGCTARSADVDVLIHPLPATPVFFNDRNRQIVKDTLNLPQSYALQWYLFNAPIAGANGLTYCVQQSGVYQLQVTDLTTGCSRTFSEQVEFDPQFDCTVDTKDLTIHDVLVYPNPTAHRLTICLPPATQFLMTQDDGSANVLITDLAGKMVHHVVASVHQNTIELSLELLPAGMYGIGVVVANGTLFRTRVLKL